MSSGRHRKMGRRGEPYEGLPRPESPWAPTYEPPPSPYDPRPYEQRPYEPPPQYQPQMPPPYEQWDAPIGRPSRRRLWIIGLVTVVVVAVATAGTAVVLLSDDGGGNGGGGGGGDNQAGPLNACAKKASLTVVVAPDIAPLVTEQAKSFGSNDGCPVIAVATESVGPVGGDGGTAQNAAPRADVWIPASSMWLRLRASNEPEGFPAEGTSLARSPIVIPMPKAVAEQLAKQSDSEPGMIPWAKLAAMVNLGVIPKFSMPSPLNTTVGLLSVMGISAAMSRVRPIDPGITQMRTLGLRARLADADADIGALLRKLQQEKNPTKIVQEIGLFPTTEQAFWSHMKTDVGMEHMAVYPADAIVEADYPLAVSNGANGDAKKKDLAAKLAEKFRTAEMAKTLAGLGYRAPAGTNGPAPEAMGLMAKYPNAIQLPTDAKSAATLAAMWAGYKTISFNVLVLLDASGSMNTPARTKDGRATTRAGILREAGVEAAKLFGAETSVGIWAFHTVNPAVPYSVMVPFGHVAEKVGNVSRREAIAKAAGGFVGLDNSGTPLFESVLRAYAEHRNRVKQDTVTLMVVLTDGIDEDSTFQMTTAQFLNRLRPMVSRERPVPIFAVGFGQGADMSSLQAMAGATNGQAIPSTDPADLAMAFARIFLAAHAPR